MISNEEHDAVQASFGRCLVSASFFRDFYDRFLASDTRVAALFAKTNWEQQLEHVRKALAMNLMLCRGEAFAAHTFERLARKHGPRGLDVPHSLYPLWLECMIWALRKNDPRFDAPLERVWRQVLAEGIARVKADVPDEPVT